MKSTINPKHLLGLDILRFIAACMVVAFHYGSVMGMAPDSLIGRVSKGVVTFPELYDATNFGWIGVEIFFVISGFVIAFSGEKASAFAFLRSRIVRLGPAVWICAPITLLATMLVGYRSDEIMYRAFRHSIAFLPREPWIDGSYWTLGIEIAFYTAVLIVIKFAKFEYIKRLAIVIGLISSVFWLVKIGAGTAGSNMFATRLKWLYEDRLAALLLVNHGMFFSLGVFLWAHLVKKQSSNNMFWIVLFCLTGCAQIIGQTDRVNAELSISYNAVMPCIIWLSSIALIFASVRLNTYLHALPGIVVKAIQVAGMMTYPLYLLHQIVGGAMMGWMVSRGIDRWVALAATTFIIFAITWVIATRAEPWLQGWTRYFITALHDRYRLVRLRFAK